RHRATGRVVQRSQRRTARTQCRAIRDATDAAPAAGGDRASRNAKAPNRRRGRTMKAAAFEYMRPTDVAGALDALEKNPGAKLIAGGQSLVPMLNLRLARPQLLVDIAAIPALRNVENRQPHLRVGAAVTHTEL